MAVTRKHFFYLNNLYKNKLSKNLPNSTTLLIVNSGPQNLMMGPLVWKFGVHTTPLTPSELYKWAKMVSNLTHPMMLNIASIRLHIIIGFLNSNLINKEYKIAFLIFFIKNHFLFIFIFYSLVYLFLVL